MGMPGETSIPFYGRISFAKPSWYTNFDEGSAITIFRIPTFLIKSLRSDFAKRKWANFKIDKKAIGGKAKRKVFYSNY